MTVSPLPTPARTATAQTTAPTARDLLAAISDLTDTVLALTERVEALEAKPARVRGALTELDRRVLDVVNSTSLKLTALVIGESIDEDNTKVGTSLVKLADQGLIGSTKRDNRTRVFHRHEAGTPA